MFLLSPAHRAVLMAAATAAGCCAPALAQSDADPVVITAARAPQRLSDTIAHTTVLTRADIEAAQAIDLASLLTAEAGVQFSGSGPRGTATSLFVRGAQNQQVLVMVDGVPLSRQDATGQVGIEHLMLDQVERIEVVRGNVSALYGAGAVGGVIQVFTRRATPGVPQAGATVEVGARGLVHGAAHGSAVVDGNEVTLGLSRVRDRGVSVLNPVEVPSANPDNDGYANTTATLGLRRTLAAGQVLGLNLARTEGRLDYDSAFATPADVQQSRTVKQMASVHSENRLGAAWTSRLLLSRQTDDANYFESGAFGYTARYLTTERSLNWINTIAVDPALTLTAGLDRQWQHIGADDGFGGGLDVSRQLWAVFGGAQARLGAHDLSLNLRHDQVDGRHVPDSASLGWGFALAPQWKLVASAASGFALPPLGYLYSAFFGNPALVPERSHSVEAGVQWSAGAQRLRATLFGTRIAQEIVYDTSTFRFENLARSRNRGLELSYDGRVFRGDWRASLTLQDPVDATSGERRLRRSRTLASLSTLQPLGDGWRAGVALRYADARPDVGGVTLPAYLLADVTAQKDLRRGWQWFGRIENVGDVRYQTAKGYNQAPRGLFTGLRWTLGG